MLEVCRKAIEEQKREKDKQESLRVMLAEARQAFQNGDVRTSQEKINKLFAVAAAHPEALELRESILERITASKLEKNRRTAEVLQQCREQIRAGDFAAAHAVSRQIVELTSRQG